MARKKIEISFRRMVTFNKIVEVHEKTAKRALALDDMDLREPRTDITGKEDWFFITEDLVDCAEDVLDMDDEIESLSIREYKKPKTWKPKR